MAGKKEFNFRCAYRFFLTSFNHAYANEIKFSLMWIFFSVWNWSHGEFDLKQMQYMHSKKKNGRTRRSPHRLYFALICTPSIYLTIQNVNVFFFSFSFICCPLLSMYKQTAVTSAEAIQWFLLQKYNCRLKTAHYINSKHK